ncbi:MAG: sigma-70 family RNA polymerase sigma factor [Planctomycetota bacterium]|nr:MAG: sigma-70 family RNA polymerase sigma factor [Planctomycetota bacterium]
MVRRAKPDRFPNKTLERLWAECRRGDSIAARNALIEYYRPFAASVVRRERARLPRTVELGDLEGAGDVGLIQAIQNYDPDRGVPFEAFCEHRVRGAILDELRRLDWLPRPLRQSLNRRRAAVDELRAELDRDPTDEEIADRLGLDLKDYLQHFGGAQDGPVMAGSKGGGEGEQGLDFLEDTRAEGPIEDANRRELLEVIAASLDEEGREILFKRFFEERSLKEIGAELELSQSRVSKILGRLVDRLKERFEGRVD